MASTKESPSTELRPASDPLRGPSLEAKTLLFLLERAKCDVRREIQHVLNSNLYLFEIANHTGTAHSTVVRAAHDGPLRGPEAELRSADDLVWEQVICRDGMTVATIFEDFPAETVEGDAVLTAMLKRYREIESALWISSNTGAGTDEYGLQFIEWCKKTMSKSDYLTAMRKFREINVTLADWHDVNYHLDVFDRVPDWQE